MIKIVILKIKVHVFLFKDNIKNSILIFNNLYIVKINKILMTFNFYYLMYFLFLNLIYVTFAITKLLIFGEIYIVYLILKFFFTYYGETLKN